MKSQITAATLLTCIALALGSIGAAPPADSILRTAETEAALQYRFSDADQALLNEVERGCFLYFWKEVGQPAQLAKDRMKAPVASIAAIGFQLSALPIGVERGWITRDEGLQRARRVLTVLRERDDNKKFGVYLHYPDPNTGGLSHEGFEILASTVDHALLLAGVITAGQYFGGELAQQAQEFVADTNWRAFAVGAGGYLSMGWRPDDPESVAGPGKFLDAQWSFASDEERLVYFLAVGAPNPDFAVPPESYYRLKRVVRQHDNLPPFVASWPGSAFTYVFSHCWIDCRRLAADDPASFGVAGPRVDWFENSRRALWTHRRRCIEQSAHYKTLAPDRWGLSPCSARDGYIVPEIQPGASGNDKWFEGTIAPYAAISAIMFTPPESLAAIRAFRALQDVSGRPLIWRDPNEGGYGFVDSFNLDQGFACDDYVGIDVGPTLLGVENARTGLIWKLFMKDPSVRRARDRLGWRASDESPPATAPASALTTPNPRDLR
jgi:hypothetical protein